MTLIDFPLSYCTNVHPGITLEQVLDGLREFTAPLQQKLGAPVAAGLWLAQPVIAELRNSPGRASQFVGELRRLGLSCYTLNAFPYGNFHSDRVKEQVYLPDWSSPERLDYTRGCAEVLAALLDDGRDGSISTVPLAFKHNTRGDGFEDAAISQLIAVAAWLSELFARTGKRIRLAIEPEPLCLLETTAETLAFFETLRARADDAGRLDDVTEYVGVCYDVCHQAVEFEDVGESLRRLDGAGIRLNKIHITCAIELDNPIENVVGRERMAEFVEPRYLHQTFARQRDGTTISAVDLTRELCLDPPEEFLLAERWRIHFHVPVNAESLGPLGTTRPALREALQTVAALEQRPHLEVETYTWSVLPGEQSVSLVDGLTAEMDATQRLLDEIAARE